MRKVMVGEFITLDGVIQSPGYPDEDPSGGFDAGGWQQQHFDDVLGQAVIDGLAASGGLLLGRLTYEIFAGFWPTAPADDPLAPDHQQPSEVRGVDHAERAAPVRELSSAPG
jgi:hypothetical protein